MGKFVLPWEVWSDVGPKGGMDSLRDHWLPAVTSFFQPHDPSSKVHSMAVNIEANIQVM